MNIRARVASLEQRAAEAPPCGCPASGSGVEVIMAADGKEPPPPAPCPACGRYKVRVVIRPADPPAPRQVLP